MSDCANPEDPYSTDTYTETYETDTYETESYNSGEMSFDSDGDGVVDTTMVDFDGDGVSDAFITTDAQGGEHMGLDVDGDGQLDTMLSDTDGDGVIDLASQDTDGDGQLDTELDPETGEPIGEPFEMDENGEVIVEDGTDDTTVTEDDDPAVHGEPMAEIPYHQAQVGPNDCLPTSVAMVLSEITGTEVPQGDLVDLANELQLLGPTGMTLEGGLQLLDHYGVDAEVQSGTTDDLRTMLDNGDQIIIGLDSDDLYGEGDQPFSDDMVAGHAVVITGIDDEAGVVYINDPGFPDGAGVAISIEAFEDAWQDSGNTMIVAEGEAAADSTAGTAGNESAAPFGAADDDESLLESIVRVVLMPFNLKVV
ncbi:MAG: C39 family peptidase [Actinomycetota bacterium]|nr:C39 family peptidase [Actinomycetota bacterium]